MTLKKVVEQLNIFAQCKRHNLPLWQCPQFLFVVMGAVICLASVGIFIIGNRYIADPTLIALIVLFIAAVLFIIAFLVIRSFENLAQANRMKSEFISVVSHQLRSPLSNLGWALDFLMSGKLGKVGEGQTEYFKILKDNVSRMKELISDLLVVSRIQSATLPFNETKFNLEEEAKKIIREFEPLAKAFNVEIELDFNDNLPKAMADPEQIAQVIENLLDNAIRYVRDRGKIKVKIGQKEKNLYFEVSDNGVGIPKEDQKFIFKKFFRSKNILKYQTQGSGLGLFIAKSIIERSDGKIGFKSQEGKGSTFWFTLPTFRR